MKRVTIILCALLAVPIFAQGDKPVPLSDVERLRVENVQLERVIVERAVKDWQAKVAALKADIEKARPGWNWNPETGELTKAPKPKE